MARVVLSVAITSSTSVVGVAVGRAGAPPTEVVFNQIETDRRHAEELTPLLALSLSQAGVGLDDVERLVVDIGPGRFTGLRVGLATVRTLALATGVPVVGVTSLETLAWAEAERPLVAVVDARRAEVFQQPFDASGPAGPAIVGRPEALAPTVAEGALIVGDGADRYRELYGPGVTERRVPSAAVMISATAGLAGGPGERVVPVYLREPDVNVNIKTRHTPR